MSPDRLLVCDLDNTLYDWVGYFVPSFYAMVDVAVEITGCDRDQLLKDFRKVHQKHGDSEHPFALLETQTIRNYFQHASKLSMIEKLDPAFHAFNSARKKNLKLHPHVRDTLEELRGAGVTLVAHTESKLFGVVDRLHRLDLFQYFAKIYCRERSLTSHPRPRSGSEWLERVPMDKIVELSHHQSKPNPKVLLEICATEGFYPSQIAYVGDSVARDILMAKRADVFSIWAAYGAQHNPATYDDLVRISHWTSEEVAREQKLKEEAKSIEPDYVARFSFAEVLTALRIDNKARHFVKRA